MQEIPLLKLRLSRGRRGSTAFLLDTSRVVVLVENWTTEKMEIKEESWEGMWIAWEAWLDCRESGSDGALVTERKVNWFPYNFCLLFTKYNRLRAMLLFIVVMTTGEHSGNLQLPTFILFAIVSSFYVKISFISCNLKTC